MPTSTRAAMTAPARTAYNGPFAALINREARKHNLDPYLLAGQLSHESAGFNPDVVYGRRDSPTGDVGVAQINLASHPDVTRAEASDPAFAIPFAAAYLDELKQRNGGSITAALRAYNTGSGAPTAVGNRYVTDVLAARLRLLAGKTVAAVQGLLAYPLGASAKIGSTPNDHRARPLGNWQSDNAVDLEVPVGTPVYSIAAGKVGPNIGPFASTSPLLQGDRLTVESGGDAFYYAHLSQLNVKAGDVVQAGQLLGYSGEANGVAHLHLGERNGNPLSLINTLQANGVKAGKGATDTSGSSTLSGIWHAITGGIAASNPAVAGVGIAAGIAGAGDDFASRVARALASPFNDAVAPFVDIGKGASNLVRDPAYPFLWLALVMVGLGLIFVGTMRLLGRSAATEAKRAATVGAAVAAPEAAPLLVNA